MEQMKHATASEHNRMRYRSPETKVVFVNVRGILCQSPGNKSMRELNYGNGGFSEEE